MSSHSDPSDNPYSAPQIISEPIPKTTTNPELYRYRIVRKGMRVIYNSIAAAILGFVISILILTVGMTSGMLFFAMVIGFIYLFIFGCGIAILIGMGMCLGAPNENERIKMIVSSAAHIIALVIAIGGGFLIGYSGIDDPPAYVGLQMAISGLSQVLSLVGTIYFTLFFRQVGSNVANARLTKSAKSALRWFLTFSIGTLLIFVMPMVVVPSNGLEVIFGVLAIFLLITAIGTLLSQLAMIRNGIAALTLPSGNSKLA